MAGACQRHGVGGFSQSAIHDHHHQGFGRVCVQTPFIPFASSSSGAAEATRRAGRRAHARVRRRAHRARTKKGAHRYIAGNAVLSIFVLLLTHTIYHSTVYIRGYDVSIGLVNNLALLKCALDEIIGISVVAYIYIRK